MNSVPDSPNELPPARRPGEVRLPARMAWVLLAAVILPWILLALRMQGDLRSRVGAGRAVSGIREGAWGRLRVHDLAIAPVDVIVPGQPGRRLDTTWVFAGYAPEKLRALFGSLDSSGEAAGRLLDERTWEVGPEAIVVHPPDEAVLGLEPGDRARLYDVLGSMPANEAHFQPWTMKTAMFADRVESAKLGEAARGLLHRLAYARGGRTFFSDVPVLLNGVADPEQQRQAMRILNSASTYQVHLVVPPDADTDAMAGYWGYRGRRKDLKPILESLAQLPGGGELDIAHVLPAFARQRLYIYPSSVLARDGVRRDCHWTSLNFFSLIPDDRFGNSEEATRFILANYGRTSETPRFGDLVLLTQPDGDCIHSAVYLAGGLAFTKNGEGLGQPWIIMDVEELRELYGFFRHADVGVQYWRELESPAAAEGGVS